MDAIPSNIILQAAAASTFVKILVDILRMATDPPRWASPLFAVSGGIAIILLLMVAGNVELTRAALANAVLAGIIAGGTAVGVTELGKRANPTERAEPRRRKTRRERKAPPVHQTLTEEARAEQERLLRGIDGPRL
jgi:hypothetical protein